jgi:hypothetical protein
MKTGKLGKTREVVVSAVFSLRSAFLTCIFQTVSCDMCKSRKDLCVYGSRVAFQVCKERKVRCSFLDAKRKCKDAEIESDDEEPTPKKPRVGGSKPSGSQPMVVILGPSQAAKQPVNEMVVLLRELVEGVRELTKVTRGMSGLGVQIYQQNAKLIRLGERQSYLAEKTLKKGSGSGSGSEKDSEEEGAGSGKDKGKGKASEGKDETMRSDRDSGSDEEDEDARMDQDVGARYRIRRRKSR